MSPAKKPGFLRTQRGNGMMYHNVTDPHSKKNLRVAKREQQQRFAKGDVQKHTAYFK